MVLQVELGIDAGVDKVAHCVYFLHRDSCGGGFALVRVESLLCGCRV